MRIWPFTRADDMKPNFLPIAIKNSGTALEELLPRVIAAPPALQNYAYICLLHRRIATGSLLATSDPEPFYAYLSKSARAFLHFLATAPDGEKLTSKAEPFFDAVACRDDEAARAMAPLCPRKPDTTREYEEDFFAVWLPMAFFFGNVPREELLPDLELFARLTKENPDPHLDVCWGLIDKDQQRFDEGLEALIDQKRKAYDKARREETQNPDEAATTAHVSTEILAYIELAQRAGLTVAPDHPLAPGVARRFHLRKPPDPDSWRVPEPFSSFKKPSKKSKR
ncbi:Imm49 family immunity protein [Myxococcus sp. SDU36]|uniref:Imm49 family immunity protein n=1 Tax=Myxococcus sp. SDU36 TaxID=2831967 RepID=UPI002543154F|nr:Imm49 family immunity protein [Myxococcus sp. SDU36]WIG94992.1 immunity 49 family protein [Myxococcus sp. SDU36]